MRTFAYARPETLVEALELLDEHGPSARMLSGGTDLLVEIRFGDAEPTMVIDLKRVAELSSEIVADPTLVRIGASAVLTDVIEHAGVRSSFPALIEAASVVGSVQIRNRATLAGNICNASPAADTAPALLVYGAKVNIVDGTDQRAVELADFFVGPGRTALEQGEIVSSIDLPIPDSPVGAAFGRMTRRSGVDLATINLCCLIAASGETRIAFGAVGPTPFMVTDETGVLADPNAADTDRDRVLTEMLSHARPISDVRGSREYREAMLRVLSRRALQSARDRLGSV